MTMYRKLFVRYSIVLLLFVSIIISNMGVSSFAASGTVTVDKTVVQVGEKVTGTFDIGWMDWSL